MTELIPHSTGMWLQCYCMFLCLPTHSIALFIHGKNLDLECFCYMVIQQCPTFRAVNVHNTHNSFASKTYPMLYQTM
jgi:hypothetical protein